MFEGACEYPDGLSLHLFRPMNPAPSQLFGVLFSLLIVFMN